MQCDKPAFHAVGEIARMAEKSNSTTLGAAGEHYVMCQLLRRNKIAALAPTGVPDADIIVSDSLGSTLAAVQVKARRNIGNDGGWHMKAKHEKMKRDLLFYCFVDFGSSLTDAPKCWVIPSDIVASVLEETHQAWFVMEGRNGRKHQSTEMRRFLPDFSRIARGRCDDTTSHPLHCGARARHSGVGNERPSPSQGRNRRPEQPCRRRDDHHPVTSYRHRP